MKKILVPCDFSGPSIQAFKFAAELASVSKGEIYLLNVMEMPVLHSSLFAPVIAYEKSFLKDIRAKANKNFEKLVDRYAKKVKVQFFVERGTVAEMVNKFIARKKIDLVIMGTHGTSGFKEFAIGSNTEKVVRSSKVPMMAVRIAPKKAAFENIIFPTNLKLEQKKTVTDIKALQNFFKAKLHILYVNDPANFTRDIFTETKLNEYAKRNQFKNYQIHIYNDIDTENGIINFSSRFKSKLIAMATHGRTGLSHLLSGSVAEDVVNHLDCPIWTSAQ
jgi:nucleotide-binding universal stress UspA family protein